MLRSFLALSALAAVSLVSVSASAQYNGQVGGSTGGGVYGSSTGFGVPSLQGPSGPAQRSSDLEIASLYITGTAFGVGAGVWFDAEAGVKDPGLVFIAPLILGAGAATGVFFLDQKPFNNRGIPASISTGLFLGAGEGVAIWSLQYTRSKEADQWKFKELTRATFLSAAVGGAAGAAVGFLQEPSPKTSLLLNTGALIGGLSGSMFGWGASADDGKGFGSANDGASLGGLIGYNLGIGAAAGLSTFWIPTYKQMLYTWAGAGIGFAATSPVYLFYAGSEKPAKRGMILQGVGTLVGAGVGAALTINDTTDIAMNEPMIGGRNVGATITNIGLMPVQGGMGAQMMGMIF